MILVDNVRQFKLLAAFQPIINGIGGNIVAVQSSRLSTYMHKSTTLGTLSPVFPNLLPSLRGVFAARSNLLIFVIFSCFLIPCLFSFCAESAQVGTARALLLFVIPGQLIFLLLVAAIERGHFVLTFRFVLLYIAAAFLQVCTNSWKLNNVIKINDINHSETHNTLIEGIDMI